MAQRKVRHGIVQYTVGEGADLRYETAFRGMEVDIPKPQELERLDSLGATVPVEEPLQRPGQMLSLPDTAGDAEIMAWVLGATADEVASLVRQNPVMAPRIETAFLSVQRRLEEQNEHLGGLRLIAKQAEQAGAEQVVSTDLSGGTTPAPLPPEGTTAVNSPGDAQGDPAAAPLGKGGAVADGAEEQGSPLADADPNELIGLPESEADKVVTTGTARVVAEYIANNPQNADAILQAEERAATKEKRDVRSTVVRAAQAAAGFANQ